LTLNPKPWIVARVNIHAGANAMKTLQVYSAIVTAVKLGTLLEPFTSNDFRAACPGFSHGTYTTFLAKHSEGNPDGNSELFEQKSPGCFKCLRPFRYGL